MAAWDGQYLIIESTLTATIDESAIDILFDQETTIRDG